MVTTITLQDLLPTTQPLLYFPADFAANTTECEQVEFEQLTPQSLKMTVVSNKDVRVRNKRYKIIRHNAGTWTSVPKTWLRMCGARAGDTIDIAWTGRFAVLTLRRKVAPKVVSGYSLRSRGSTRAQTRGAKWRS